MTFVLQRDKKFGKTGKVFPDFCFVWNNALKKKLVPSTFSFLSTKMRLRAKFYVYNISKMKYDFASFR